MFMRFTKFYLGFILIFLAISIISASSYSVEYTQVGDKVVVKEKIDGKSLGGYVDLSLIDKSGDIFYFIKRVNFNQSFDDVEIKLNLDTGVIIKDNLIFPSGYKIESDGQIISIVWSLSNIKSGQDFAIFITTKDTKSDFAWIYWLVAIMVLIIVGFAIYPKLKIKLNKSDIKRTKKKINSKKENKEDYDYLLDTEKRVIEELKKADRNELWQKQIQSSTGFSKAKVSRLVRNLEARNLVVKIPFGNTNKVRLK